ncbi:ribosomal RNA small subunit methyltransferase H [Ligilactobacillus pabuli]|uniref:Ribosomal RNA small subunit methyltransferase H n=1 Tax=Ligilactobacillus pabuli TaxID=2886039 RepID=A0ABQ5JJ54_9LACO|nr:16S rRNA (cytosine(1402)-N(4))-methyltransferase RsmH [Ligilactobacillus pabuli]GKS81928.1 ribosomal RNA small subunit methyltransferase H [Ligilactobacillus pabuli]HIW88304.1 16S rRNA (cytosine(1402)-N(4))-methyltransferase RsmH [Candidatus Ligilactobacillus excrementipullorum]
MAEFKHETVLLNEAVEKLNIKQNGIYVDCTLGGGGHSRKILGELDATGKLFSFDQDETAIKYNQQNLAKFLANGQLTLIQNNFREIKSALAERNISGVDGIVYDLGVSSPQFDVASRGFSYRADAPLDMRMNQQQELTAEKIVNEWSYQDLVRIFFRYGEEKHAKSIARKIEKSRQEQPIKTTEQLVELIKQGIPAKDRRHGGHPAKKTFQALRIAVNDELGALEESLEQALDLLLPGGRISVITFQSLEDRLVKTLFKEKSSLPELPPGLPVIPTEMQPDFKLVTRKPLIPTAAEIERNHRAHSAKLRVIEKI